MIHIYLLICPVTGRTRYVGLTRAPKRRMCQHRLAKSPNHRLNRWFAKLRNLGVEPTMQIIYSVESDVIASEIERSLIATIRSHNPDLINLGQGGEGGFVVSDETRAKISQARKKAKGKYKMTDAHKAAIAKALKGRPNPNRKGFVKLNKSRTGIPLSPEHKKRVSESLKGRVRTDEFRKKMSEIAKIREARKKDGGTRTTVAES